MWTGVEVVYGLAGSEKEISTLKKANKAGDNTRIAGHIILFINSS